MLFFNVIINGIIYLISFSDCSLLVYSNKIYFCILILYPETMLDLFINSNSFLVFSLGFYIYMLMSSEHYTVLKLFTYITIKLIYIFHELAFLEAQHPNSYFVQINCKLLLFTPSLLHSSKLPPIPRDSKHSLLRPLEVCPRLSRDSLHHFLLLLGEGRHVACGG